MESEKSHVVESDSKDTEDGCCTNGYFDKYFRPFFVEFIGSMVYVFAAGMSVQSADVPTIALAQGLAITTMAITFTPVR